MVILMKKEFRERECIHQDDGAEGAFYNGVFYLQALQRLPVDAAVRMSSKVSSFFWADAPHILVWLCQDARPSLGSPILPADDRVQGGKPKERLAPGGSRISTRKHCYEARANR